MKKSLGVILKKLREENGISQKTLSQVLQKPQQHISLWETNKNKPDADTIIALAIYFGVSTDYLLGLTNNMYTDYNRKKDADEMAMSLDNSIHVNQNKVRGNIHIKK